MTGFIRTSIPGFLNRIYRSKGGLWFPDFDEFSDPKNNALAIVGKPYGKLVIPGRNIVTDAGDIHYAQLGAGEAATNAFTVWEQQSAGTPAKGADRSDFTAIASSEKVQDTGYPKTNDDDTDNTGAAVDVRTTRVSYTAADFNHAAITHSIVTNATPGASEPILSGWAWAASINKTADDTLKGLLNHQMNGV